MNRRPGAPTHPIGRAPLGSSESAATTGSTSAVGFDPLADSGQGPAQQRAQLGTLLLAPTQRTPQLRIAAANPPGFGYIALPPYVGWVQLFPRVVLPNTDPIPDAALPTRVGYFNGPGPLPGRPSDSAAVEEWVKSYGTPIHTHFSVTLEPVSSLIHGTPFSEAAPVFLPAGINIAVFQGVNSTDAWADFSYCALTAIAAPRNESLLYPPGPHA